MTRDLHLTSPLERGLDIQHLQQACNQHLEDRGDSSYAVKVDGQYGPATEHAVARCAYDLGLDAYDGSTAVTRIIEHPLLRNPAQLERAASRAKARKESTQGLAAVPSVAAKYLGVHETPAGSNRGDQVDVFEKQFGMLGEPWCGLFAGYCIEKAGGKVTSRVAYVPYIEADARTGTNGFARWTTDRSQVKPGWLVVYQFSGSVPDHTEIVKEMFSDHVDTYGGNTGGPDPADGGMVALNHRTFGTIVGYAEPRI